MNQSGRILSYVWAAPVFSFLLSLLVIANAAAAPISKRSACREATKLLTDDQKLDFTCKSFGVLDVFFNFAPPTAITSKEIAQCEAGYADCQDQVSRQLDLKKLTKKCERRLSSSFTCELTRQEVQECRNDIVSVITAANQGATCESLLKEAGADKNNNSSQVETKLPVSCQQIKEKCPRLAKQMQLS